MHWQAEFDDMADGRPDVFIKQGWDMREGWEPSLRLKSEMGKNILLHSSLQSPIFSGLLAY